MVKYPMWIVNTLKNCTRGSKTPRDNKAAISLCSNSKLYKEYQLVSGLYSAIQLISMRRPRKLSLTFTRVDMTDISRAIKTLWTLKCRLQDIKTF
jgi:hypothetical protein